MHICIWSNWFRENLHHGTKKSLFVYLYIHVYVMLHIYNLYSILETNDISLQTGPEGATEKDWGVNYRALNDLFRISQVRKNTFTYEISVQMMEIYNEQVRDLLSSDGSQKRYPLCSHFIFFDFFNVLANITINLFASISFRISF